VTCTLRFALHAEVPTVDNDYWVNYMSADGVGYAGIDAWWGDFGQCNGWGSAGLDGYDIGYLFGPGPWTVGYMVRFYTTDNGCGPGAAGGAGIMLDDTWLEGDLGVAVEDASWGAIKSMYR
jgi:hypothetical protein